MKTIVKIVFVATIIFLPFCGFSQILGYTKATDMDVNGIFIGGKYTKAQVIAKWGNPTDYRDSTSESGLNETYYYSSDTLRFSENGVFETFNIKTSKFAVYTAKSGGIKVGDPISRISAIGLGIPVLQSHGNYSLSLNSIDEPLMFVVSNSIITEIWFMSSI